MRPKGGGYGLLQLAAVDPHQRQLALIFVCFCRTLSTPHRPPGSIARCVTCGGVCATVSTGRRFERHGLRRHPCCLLVSASISLVRHQHAAFSCVCAQHMPVHAHERGRPCEEVQGIGCIAVCPRIRWPQRHGRSVPAVTHKPVTHVTHTQTLVYVQSHMHTGMDTSETRRQAKDAHKQAGQAGSERDARITPGERLDKAAGEMQVGS